MPSPDPSSQHSPPSTGRPNRLGRLVRRLVIYPVVILGAILVISCTHIVESRVFYAPSRESFQTPPEYEDVSIQTPDGLTLHGWFVPPADAKTRKGPWPAILHCHGNAGNVSSHIDFSVFLPEHGLALLIFDYRGYGRSSPASGLTRDTLMIDARAALEYLRSRPDVDPARIGLYGVSLGGVFASHMAAGEPTVRALCTVSAFSSWSAIAGDHAPVLGPLLIPSGLDPVDAVGRLGSRPYLLVHGDRDEIVSVHHADILESSARSGGAAVTRMIVAGADHNGILANDPDSEAALAEFFVRNLAK